MTKFAFEVPHFNLEDFEDLQDFHYMLSLNWECLRYKRFYLRQAKLRKKPIWLDNSYNETGVADDVSSMQQIALQVNASEIIAPDDPTWKTEQIAKAYLKTEKLWPKCRTIVVVSSPEMKEALEDLGAQHFAISYHTRLPAYKQGATPHDFLWAKNCHFLGLCSVHELEVIRPTTCDTSMPIKIALRDQTLKGWEEEGCPHIHTKDDLSFFDKRLMGVQLRLARANIKQLKERCKCI